MKKGCYYFYDRINALIPTVITEYIKGQTCENIAKQLHINKKTVIKILNKNEIALRKRKKNLVGNKYGKLTVIAESHTENNRKIVWLCKCSCGNFHKARGNDLKMGKIISCGCVRNGLSEKRLKKYQRKIKKSGKRFNNWHGFGEISGGYINRIKRHALMRNLEHNVTNEYLWLTFLKQNRRCALSGIKIIFNDSSLQTASLDRIDSNKGYVEGNVQWLHKDVNNMKQHYSEEYFIGFCKKIVNNRKK